MPWYAVEALEDAIEATKALLLPLDARTWLKLALVVFFLGGMNASPPTGGAEFTTGPGGPAGPGVPGGPGEPVGPVPGEFVPPPSTLAVVLGAVLVIAVLLVVAFTFVGSVLEFVFVESLRAREVRVRRYARDHLGRGFRLFVFRLVVFTLLLLPFGGFALAAGLGLGFVPAVPTELTSVTVGLLLLLLPILVLVGVVIALVDGFTTNFVVPVMLVRESGVIAGWRAFWPVLRREWKQYGVYVLVRFVLSIAAGIVVAIVSAPIALALLIPFAVLGAVLFTAFGSFEAIFTSAPALAVFGVLAAAYVLLLLFALAVVRVPVQTYLRYFALLVLGDTERGFDVIPELREEIRR